MNKPTNQKAWHREMSKCRGCSRWSWVGNTGPECGDAQVGGDLSTEEPWGMWDGILGRGTCKYRGP